MVKVKLFCSVFHNDKTLAKGDIEEMTEKEATRLVSLGAAEIIQETKTGQSDDGKNYLSMTVKELETILEASGVAFSKKFSKDKLIELVTNLTDNAKLAININDLSREELRFSLKEKGVQFSDDEEIESLRTKLFIELIKVSKRDDLETYLSQTKIEFSNDESDESLKTKLIDYYSSHEE